MASRFWGAESSSSESESSDSADEAPVAAAAMAGRKPMARWAEESSSDDDDQPKRTIRSHTDKRYDQLADRLKQMKNHLKIEDFASLIVDYDTVFKMLDKLKNLIDQDGGPPNSFIMSITRLERRVEELHSEGVQKTLNQNKSKAFNTLRAKIRKNINYKDEVERCKEHPSEFEEEEVDDKGDDGDDTGSDSGSDAGGSASSKGSGSSSSSSGSGSSSSDSDSDSDSSSSSGSSSSKSKSWKSGSSSSDDEDKNEEEVREKKMLRWVITPEELAKRKKKEDEEADTKKKKADGKEQSKKDKHLAKGEKVGKKEAKAEPGKKEEQKEDKYEPEELKKKITEIAQSRGRKGFDRKMYVEKLDHLVKHAKEMGPSMNLYILSTKVSANFDNTGSAFAAMRVDLWNSALVLVEEIFPLLKESYAAYKEAGGKDVKYPLGSGEEDGVVVLDDDGEDPTRHPRQQELFVAFLEKLDDELYKALQFTVDVYGSEYQEILSNSSKLLRILKRSLKFFEETKQIYHRGITAFRLLEQLHYKHDVLNKAVYTAIQHGVPEEEKEQWIWPENSKDFMAQLGRYACATSMTRLQRRSALCQAYHLALHNHFQIARDLLHLGNVQEHAADSDVNTQVIYNRTLAQMGLCAFRLGKIQEAHNFLMDVCMHNKARELLAQGLSFRNQDRTPEQERDERLRQLPYHMHINLEVLESAHYICAMLLEVPNIAMQAIDPSSKRVISRVLRKQLEQSDRQIFAGPPENAREAVVSASKALQKGDWSTAMVQLDDLKLWEHIDAGYDVEAAMAVKEMIKTKVKIEALRTYLFTYASIYDAFHLDKLEGMFELEPKTIHSAVSKMMLKEEITAFWDESSKFVLVQHSEPTPLQRLALTLADRSTQAVENNERLVDAKIGGYGFKEARPQNNWGGDKGGGKGQRRGKGGAQGPVGDRKGKGKGKGGFERDNTARDRGWGNARAGLQRGTGGPSSGGQRGWGSRPA